MNCYSNYTENKEECKKCKYKSYCMESADIPLIINNRGRKLYENKIQLTPIERVKAFNSDKKEFSKAEMLELIAFMVSLDETTIELLSEKLNDPTISIAELGKRRNITRQGVHKYIKQRCEQHPELAVIFQNKQNKHKKNFLEVGTTPCISTVPTAPTAQALWFSCCRVCWVCRKMIWCGNTA